MSKAALPRELVTVGAWLQWAALPRRLRVIKRSAGPRARAQAAPEAAVALRRAQRAAVVLVVLVVLVVPVVLVAVAAVLEAQAGRLLTLREVA